MLSKLILEPKNDTPGIVFDPENNKFEIYGKSLPEDSTEFYEPVIDFLEEYASEPNDKTKLVINFEYYNSASVRKIINILTIMEEISLEGHDVSVVWMYEDTDEVMRENGEDFQDTVDIPFEIKSFKFDY